MYGNNKKFFNINLDYFYNFHDKTIYSSCANFFPTVSPDMHQQVLKSKNNQQLKSMTCMQFYGENIRKVPLTNWENAAIIRRSKKKL